MRLLLFFICFLFSSIFYVFNKINSWENLFWYQLKKITLQSISWNLIIESLVFFVLWIVFVLYFTPNLKPDYLIEKLNKNTKFFYILFYIIFFVSLLSWKIFYDTFILFSLIFFVFSDITFNIFSNLAYFKEQRENLRYFSLFLNFASSFIALYYIFNFEYSFLLVLVLVFNLWFNYLLYQKYKNLACLMVVYTILIFLLFFLILRIYYFLKLNLVF